MFTTIVQNRGARLLDPLQRALLFPRRLAALRHVGRVRPAGVETLWLETSVGKVELWLLAPYRHTTLPAPLVFYAHGNAELIDDWAEPLSVYREHGAYLALLEYRGYGRSAGEPSVEAIFSDAVDAISKLINRPEIDRERVVYHGRSLGGGVACALAAVARPRALILESTFASLAEVVTDRGLPRWLAPHGFESCAAIRSIDVPTLIIHGRRDMLIPFAHAERLQAAAPNATLFDDHLAGHNDLPRHRDAYWAAIAQHLHASGVLENAM